MQPFLDVMRILVTYPEAVRTVDEVLQATVGAGLAGVSLARLPPTVLVVLKRIVHREDIADIAAGRAPDPNISELKELITQLEPRVDPAGPAPLCPEYCPFDDAPNTYKAAWASRPCSAWCPRGGHAGGTTSGTAPDCAYG